LRRVRDWRRAAEGIFVEVDRYAIARCNKPGYSMGLILEAKGGSAKHSVGCLSVYGGPYFSNLWASWEVFFFSGTAGRGRRQWSKFTMMKTILESSTEATPLWTTISMSTERTWTALASMLYQIGDVSREAHGCSTPRSFRLWTIILCVVRTRQVAMSVHTLLWTLRDDRILLDFTTFFDMNPALGEVVDRIVS
jgi:hypothetical protein